MYSFHNFYRSEGFGLREYVVPGCVDDGAWMLWGNSSAVAAVVAHPGWVAGRGSLKKITNKIDTFCQNSFVRDWAPYERWGAHRTVEIRVVAMSVFFSCIIFQKNGFPARGRFHDFDRLVGVLFLSKLTQEFLGVVGEHPRPIRAHI